MPRTHSREDLAVPQQLDKTGFIPLYYQIQRVLMEKIRAGELAEGDLLASEEELSRVYKVSRMTARQALHGLKTSGYAVSEKGRGTFVTRPKLEKNIMHLQGFTGEMRERGVEPGTRLLEQSVGEPSADVMEKLRLAPGDKVLRLRRLRLADGTPIAIEDSRIPLKQFPGIDRLDFERQSLYQVMRDRYGVRVAYADEVIEALPATAEEVQLLNIPRRISVLSILRVLMTTQDAPVEVTCSRYRGDRYRASIRVPTTPVEWQGA